MIRVVGVLFILELLLGFNGTLLVVGGIGIRKLLFFSIVAITIVSVLLRIKQYGIMKIMRCFNKLDYIILFFLITQVIWVIGLPIIVKGSLQLAIKEALSLITLILYFPVVVLLRTKDINWSSTRAIIKYTSVVLASIHLLLYIGETIVGDATFAISFFETIGSIVGGHSKRPIVMMPMYYIRIIYSASIFLLVPFYFILQCKWNVKAIIYYIVAVAGILTTLTKSLLIGVMIGLGFYVIYMLITTEKANRFHKKVTYIKSMMIMVIVVIVLDHTVFGGYVLRRLDSTFVVKSHAEQELTKGNYLIEELTTQEIRDLDELAGTERSNYTRIEQTKELLNKWQHRPWFGFGYGSYVETYLRGGGDTPYSYEMFLPALLMKIGLVGVGTWIAFTIYILKSIYKQIMAYRERATALMFLVIALGVAAQFNPFLLNACGMGIVLFILVELRYMQLGEQQETMYVKE